MRTQGHAKTDQTHFALSRFVFVFLFFTPMARITFYYDVVCPYAYMASAVLESFARRTGIHVCWKPVLLGGLYASTKAPQGKDGSATDIMPPAKKAVNSRDFLLQLSRHGIPRVSPPAQHPVKTLDAMRFLTQLEGPALIKTTHALYQAYWQEGQDLADHKILAKVANIPLDKLETILNDEACKLKLRSNTEEAAEIGAFGVPSFNVNGKLFWGTDHLFLAARSLGVDDHPLQLIPKATNKKPVTVTFYHDFSSPWSFIGSTQIERVLEATGANVRIEWVPILLGAVFKAIGTPNVPLAAISEAKRNWNSRSLALWQEYYGAISANKPAVKWPSNFPLRTVLPLRCVCAEPSPQLTHAIYKAAWTEDKNVGQPEVLRPLLEDLGYHADTVLEKAQSPEIKEQLKKNTARAIEEGVCGVPSFQVNSGPIIWGQDRLNVVADFVNGWDGGVVSKSML
eukprot:m.19903 g.19903  ORF g.19903 m.19903 type:complete len:455 (+) comp12345_c0_seq1:102-1466(+)